MRARLAAALLGLAVLAGVPATASAQVRLGEVSGVRPRAFRAALVEALRGEGITLSPEGPGVLDIRIVKRGQRHEARMRLRRPGRPTQRLRAVAQSLHGTARAAARRLREPLGNAGAGAEPTAEPEPPPRAPEARPRRPEPEPEPEPEVAPAPAGPGISVAPFQGPQAGRLRGALGRGLNQRDDVEVVGWSQVRRSARTENLDLEDEEDAARAVAATGGAVIVTGEVERSGSRWVARLLVSSAPEAEPLGDPIELRAGSPNALVNVLRRRGAQEVAALAVAGAGSRESARAERERERAQEDAEEREEAEARRRRRRDDAPSEGGVGRRALLDVGLGGRFFQRRYRYNDDLFGRLRGYDLDDGIAFVLRGRVFPGARSTDGWGGHIGLEVAYDVSKIDSVTAGRIYPTTSSGLLLGGLFRYPFGEKHQADFGAGWAVRRFDFDPAGPSIAGGRQNQTDVPSAGYEAVRLSAGTRLHVAAGLYFSARASLRWIYDLGGIEADTWFPFAQGNGFDASARLGYELPLGFVVRLGFEYQRYWMTLNPDPESARWIAGGALDQYLFYDLSVAWRY
ncbi:MAG: hypothetical protein AAGH15_09970 [Myxococcota bacterium]